MNILIIGATSAMAQSVSRVYAKSGAQFFLVGRNATKLSSVADDLTVRGAKDVATRVIDLNDFSAHANLVADAFSTLGSVDQVLVAHGYLGEQDEAEGSAEETEKILRTNFNSPISLLTSIANRLEMQKKGTLAVISSVAGDRGRRSNYVYGSAKAGLSIFLEGLELRLAKSGVKVVILKPGFVDSPMTREMKKGVLWASSERAGVLIQKAMSTKQGTVYIPGFWRWIMLIIRALPKPIFRRLPI